MPVALRARRLDGGDSGREFQQSASAASWRTRFGCFAAELWNGWPPERPVRSMTQPRSRAVPTAATTRTTSGWALVEQLFW
jgi:hypothetical protein